MKFVVISVASVEESVGFRLIGRLEAETQEETDEILPNLVMNMEKVLEAYDKNTAQPEVRDNTIYYRAVSLPELAFILGLFNKNLALPTKAYLSDELKLYPEEIGSRFRFQFDCFKVQNNL